MTDSRTDNEMRNFFDDDRELTAVLDRIAPDALNRWRGRLSEFGGWVAGEVEGERGRIDLPIGDHPASRVYVRLLAAEGRDKAATTLWTVEQRAAGKTLLRLFPKTGRRHQLRVHLEAIGHPILGDDLYAPPDALAMADRLMLHAESLWIVHPGTGAPMTFEAACPF